MFRAKKTRLPLASLLKVHSYARRIGLASLDYEILRLSLQTPTLSTRRAQSELGWSAKHSSVSVLKEWARSFTTTDRDEAQALSGAMRDALVEPAPQVDYRSLYQRSLRFFGQRVHAIPDDQWTKRTEYEGWNVWELVASVARDQYRTALRLPRRDGRGDRAKAPR